MVSGSAADGFGRSPRSETRRTRLSVGLRGSGIVAVPFAMACSLCLPSDANAQATVPSITPPASAKRFAADVRTSVGYATNVSGGDKTLAAIRRIEPNDVTYVAGATLKFRLLSGRNTAFLTAAADARRHARNQILDGEDYLVSAGVGTQLGPCSGLIGASYARRQSLIDDLALPVIENLTTPVVTNITNQPLGTVSINCGRGALFGSVQGAIGKLQNDVNRPGFVDSNSKSGSVSIGYRNATLGDLSLIGQYSKVAYSNAVTTTALPALPLNPDFEQYSAGIQYARKIGNRLSGTAAVLATRLESVDIRSTGVSASAGLSYKVSSRIQLKLDYDLSNQASVFSTTRYLRAQSLTFSSNYRISQRISLNASVQGARDQYRGGIVSPMQLRESKQVTANVGGALRVGRNIQLTLSGSRTERDADVSLYDFQSNNVTLGLTTQF